METDLDTAARFLAALTGDTDHTFQTYDDSRARKQKALNRQFHGTLSRYGVPLSALNLKGAAVAVLVNRGDQMGRKSENVLAARALWVDLDGSPIEPVLEGPIRPRIVVESSPGKWHAYWPIVDLPLGLFAQAQHALADRFGGDHKVAERARVMRLPGFWHNKGEPFQSRLVFAEHAPLTWTEVADAFGLARRFQLPQTIPKGERNTTIYGLAARGRRTGVGMAEQLEKAHLFNARRFEEPLSAAEIEQTVASAYAGADRSVRFSPTALWESPQFKALTWLQRVLILAAYARADGYGDGIITLPHSELAGLFPDKDGFWDHRTALVNAGLLRIVQPPVKRMPRLKRGPKPTYFQLVIGPFLAPYNVPEIPPQNHTPVVIQAVSSAPPDTASEDSGPERSAA